MRICLICSKREYVCRHDITPKPPPPPLLPALQTPLPPQLGPVPIDMTKVASGSQRRTRSIPPKQQIDASFLLLHKPNARLALSSPSPFARPCLPAPANDASFLAVRRVRHAAQMELVRKAARAKFDEALGGMRVSPDVGKQMGDAIQVWWYSFLPRYCCCGTAYRTCDVLLV